MAIDSNFRLFYMRSRGEGNTIAASAEYALTGTNNLLEEGVIPKKMSSDQAFDQALIIEHTRSVAAMMADGKSAQISFDDFRKICEEKDLYTIYNRFRFIDEAVNTTLHNAGHYYQLEGSKEPSAFGGSGASAAGASTAGGGASAAGASASEFATPNRHQLYRQSEGGRLRTKRYNESAKGQAYKAAVSVKLRVMRSAVKEIIKSEHQDLYPQYRSDYATSVNAIPEHLRPYFAPIVQKVREEQSSLLEQMGADAYREHYDKIYPLRKSNK